MTGWVRFGHSAMATQCPVCPKDMKTPLVQGRIGIALRFGRAVDGTQAVQLRASGQSRRYSRRQLFANAAIVASRVGSLAVRRRTVLVLAKGQRPHPRRTFG